MNVLERIIAQAATAACNNQEFESVTLSLADYAELQKEVGASRHVSDPMPQPPIKASMDSWFSSSIEYDYHAPKYLQDLSVWQDRNKHRGFEALTLNLATGPCKVYVGYNEV